MEMDWLPISDNSQPMNPVVSQEKEEEKENTMSFTRTCNVWSSTVVQDVRKMTAIINETDCKCMAISFATAFVPDLRQLTPSCFLTFSERNYQKMRVAASTSDPVQVAFTLFNTEGKTPTDTFSTFQFNLRISHDFLNNQSSKDLSLIFYDDFSLQKHKEEGILITDLVHLLKEANIFNSTTVFFYAYEGGLDYVYLVKSLNNNNLPLEFTHFNTLFKQYLPKAYDLKRMCKFQRAIFAELERDDFDIPIDFNTKLITLANAVGLDQSTPLDLSVPASRTILLAKVYEKLHCLNRESDVVLSYSHIIYGLNAF